MVQTKEQRRKSNNKYYRKKHKESPRLWNTSNKRTRDNIKKYIESQKKKGKCAFCPVDDFRVLQFHHLNPKEKEFNLSTAATRKMAIRKIDKEISKCILICANCHSLIHYEERIAKPGQMHGT